jgi:hypothetical protein
MNDLDGNSAEPKVTKLIEGNNLELMHECFHLLRNSKASHDLLSKCS